ncbi:MAG: hypothetical protein KJ067_25070 [Vicinamibacteria bacterium]|jgi:hypothetical protein|nr:hypothetical protein [Vicinamibacteria bacterium]
MKALALGAMVAGLALAQPADAGVSVGIGISVGDRGHWDRRGYGYDAGREAWRFGYDRGYREGLEEGSQDGRRNQRFDFWRERDYRNADKGYRRHYGPKPIYERGFREGFEAGYRRGYARHDDRRDGRWDGRDRGRIYEEPRRRW